jgi:hypothetical protein
LRCALGHCGSARPACRCGHRTLSTVSRALHWDLASERVLTAGRGGRPTAGRASVRSGSPRRADSPR